MGLIPCTLRIQEKMLGFPSLISNLVNSTSDLKSTGFQLIYHVK